MSTINTEKIRRNADLVVPFSACPFGEPIEECPFREYYALNDEIRQIEQIDHFPQEELDKLRDFHRSCRDELIKTRDVKFKELPY